MSTGDATLIRFEEHRTTLAPAAMPEVVVPIGASAIATKLFRHDPPTPLEIEQAIDWVEDALAVTGLRQATRGDLHTSEPALLELLGLRDGGSRLPREDVEVRFQRVASIARGHVHRRDGFPLDATGAAMLLILREFMHHLGYQGIWRGASIR